jgi:hypothetical protein
VAATDHIAVRQFRMPGVSSSSRRHGTYSLSIYGKPSVSRFGVRGQQGIATNPGVPDFRSSHVAAERRPRRRG